MKNAQNFSENYQTLQKIAQQLSHSTEVDIDQLVPMVDEATKAYQACKSRLDAIEKALSERLDHSVSADSQSENTVPNPDFTESDIPF